MNNKFRGIIVTCVLILGLIICAIFTYSLSFWVITLTSESIGIVNNETTLEPPPANTKNKAFNLVGE